MECLCIVIIHERNHMCVMWARNECENHCTVVRLSIPLERAWIPCSGTNTQPRFGLLFCWCMVSPRESPTVSRFLPSQQRKRAVGRRFWIRTYGRLARTYRYYAMYCEIRHHPRVVRGEGTQTRFSYFGEHTHKTTRTIRRLPTCNRFAQTIEETNDIHSHCKW